ncbi:MAG: hypothetical protein ABIP62_09410 [Vicinamibacteria bacterium]
MKTEHLPGKVQVKGTMLQAHLEWLSKQVPDRIVALKPHLPDDVFKLVSHGVLATSWITLKTLITVDRAIAKAARNETDQTFRELGRHSATSNLQGVYSGFVTEEPHRFFDRQSRLHSRFQDFGRSLYEVVSPREGRLTLEDYLEYSPVFCLSAVGYYVGALETMKVPGPIDVRETKCVCSGDPACVFQIKF